MGSPATPQRQCCRRRHLKQGPAAQKSVAAPGPLAPRAGSDSSAEPHPRGEQWGASEHSASRYSRAHSKHLPLFLPPSGPLGTRRAPWPAEPTCFSSHWRQLSSLTRLPCHIPRPHPNRHTGRAGAVPPGAAPGRAAPGVHVWRRDAARAAHCVRCCAAGARGRRVAVRVAAGAGARRCRRGAFVHVCMLLFAAAHDHAGASSPLICGSRPQHRGAHAIAESPCSASPPAQRAPPHNPAARTPLLPGRPRCATPATC
jgi:hypothetical protein